MPFTVPSSKNGGGISRSGNSFPSKQTSRWRRLTKNYWLDGKKIFDMLIKNQKIPLLVGLHFVRGRDDLYDWVNPVQTIQDEMVKYDWINDDNVFIMFPFPFKIGGTYTSYSKENPGVYIKILDHDI